MDRDKLRIGVLGAGRIGRIHGGNVAVHPRARLAAVADASREAARSLAEATGAEIADGRRRSSRRRTSTRSSSARRPTRMPIWSNGGARAGKAIFCEKPVSLDAERTAPACASCEETGTALMIGFNRRFDPSFATLRRRIADGRDRRGRARHDPVARSLAAAGGLPGTVGRAVPGHDDPRLRHGALPPRRGAGRGARGRLLPGRSGDRPRPAMSTPPP